MTQQQSSTQQDSQTRYNRDGSESRTQGMPEETMSHSVSTNR